MTVLPAQVPRLHGHRGQRLARWLLRRAGWTLVGELPDVDRLVLIAAPHSSWWDGVWGLLMKMALGLDVSFMAKRELFVGPLGWLLRRLGGIPIERRVAGGVVAQMVARFERKQPLWLGITPEGTRKRVNTWKTGFWRIAHEAQVPVLPIWFHYPDRQIGVGALFQTSDDMAADMRRLREIYVPWQGRRRGVT